MLGWSIWRPQEAARDTCLAEYRVLAVEMGLLGIRYEELRLVGIRARVRHGKDATVVELSGGNHVSGPGSFIDY